VTHSGPVLLGSLGDRPCTKRNCISSDRRRGDERPWHSLRNPVQPPQPCFCMRFAGMSGGRATHECRDSSHTEIVGSAKFGSAKVPMATAT
jgi:hypothetical protein